MPSHFTIPKSLQKGSEGEGREAAPRRALHRPTLSYADLDDPNGAPVRERPNRSNFSLRRAPDGSRIPREAGLGPPRSLATRPRSTHLTSKTNPYVLKRTVPRVTNAPSATVELEEGEVDEPSTSTFQAVRDSNPFVSHKLSPARHPPARSDSPVRVEKKTDRGTVRSLTSYNLSNLHSINEVARSLQALSGRHCAKDFDRYQLLDERDKLLCKLREIAPHLFRKTGCCPDMCPEKERYVRIVQMRISEYELDMMGEMDPSRTVKEYSRSAADQEEPMEHEMRDGPVLVKTMEYLLTSIVDAMPSVAEAAKWYDFLWNRTRAIRKELTQQMMTDETAVLLIERCTRLHMFAGYALCTLDQTDFDIRMNEENLSKCLQSLRHLYEDLAKKEIFCDSEAEFRAYDVMLHLDDSNILRQVLSYRRAVRESPAVRLAIRLASTLQSNNFIRFFRLLREQATFLQCCIVHRYFNKMRSAALSSMCKAYQKGSLYPLDLLTTHLAFDNDEETVEAAAGYCLYRAPDESSMLQLDRDAFIMDPNDKRKPCEWIEGKRDGRLLSEILRGAPSPRHPTPLNVPINSFDSNGVYSKDPVLAAFMGKIGGAAAMPPPAPVVKKAPVEVVKPSTVPFGLPSSTSAFGGWAKKVEEKGSKASFSFGKPSTSAFGGFGLIPKTEVTVKQEEKEYTVDRELEKKKQESVENTAGFLVERMIETHTMDTVKDCLTDERRIKEEKERRKREEEKRKRDEAERREKEKLKAEKDKKEKQARRVQRLSSVSETISKHSWPLVMKEVDGLIMDIVQTEVRREEKRMAEGLARYKARMHKLWIKQFTDRWKAYAKWKKEQRIRVYSVLEAVVCRDTVVSPKSKRPCLESRSDSSFPYAHLHPLHAMQVVEFEERRRRKLMRGVVWHWKEWAEGRIRRRVISGWLASPLSVIRIRSSFPGYEEEEETKKEEERRMATAKRKTRRSIGLYSFLAADDSFLAAPATPMSTVNCENRRVFASPKGRVLNSTVVSGMGGIAFDEFVRMHASSADLDGTLISEDDMSYALDEMDRTGWRTGLGMEKKRRWRDDEERLIRGAKKRTQPSWKELFDSLNDEEPPEKKAMKRLERREELVEEEGEGGDMETFWIREERVLKEKEVEQETAANRLCEEARRIREETNARIAEMEALLARYGE